jgi:hypothetical protein
MHEPFYARRNTAGHVRREAISLELRRCDGEILDQEAQMVTPCATVRRDVPAVVRLHELDSRVDSDRSLLVGSVGVMVRSSLTRRVVPDEPNRADVPD